MPPALRPWQAILSQLPDPIHDAIGPWLGRLARSIGPLRRNSIDGEGAPDGFSGLTRRGTYDRLLMTEWALAEAFPDEFIRRAAHREHLFLQLSRREPASAQRSVLLFDVGPDQLGGPHVAHLALLVVLAQRAVDAGAQMTFGVLQAGPPGHSAFSAETAQRFMRTRSPRRPHSDDWQAWLTTTSAGVDGGPDDWWVIGGPAIHDPNVPSRAQRIEVSEVPDVGRRAIAIKVSATRTTEVVLDLPPVPACVSILRDPYRRPSPVIGAARPAAEVPHCPQGYGLRFSATDRFLFTRTDRGVAAYELGRAGRREAGPTRYLDLSGAPTVAVETYRKQFFVLGTAHGAFRLFRFNRRGQLDSTVELGRSAEFMAPGADVTPAPLFPVPGSNRQRLLTLDALGRAFVLHLKSTGDIEGPLFEAVAIRRTRRGLHALVPTDDHSIAFAEVDENARLRPLRTVPVKGNPTAFFISGAKWHVRAPFVVGGGFDGWYFGPEQSTRRVEEGEPIGAITFSGMGWDQGSALVSLAPDRNKVRLHRPGGVNIHRPLPVPARGVALAQEHPLLAVLADDHTIHVLNLLFPQSVESFAPMNRAKPRQVVFRGRRNAGGFVFDAFLAERERRRRVWRYWRPGASAFRLDDGAYVILWPDPIAIDTATSPGAVVTRYGPFWTATPLPSVPSPPHESLWLVRARNGELQWSDLSAASALNPSAWVDVSALELVSVESLGEPPPPLEVVQTSRPRRLREVVGFSESAAMTAARRALTERGHLHADIPVGAETPWWRRWIARRLASVLRRIRSTDARWATRARRATRPVEFGTEGPQAITASSVSGPAIADDGESAFDKNHTDDDDAGRPAAPWWHQALPKPGRPPRALGLSPGSGPLASALSRAAPRQIRLRRLDRRPQARRAHGCKPTVFRDCVAPPRAAGTPSIFGVLAASPHQGSSAPKTRGPASSVPTGAVPNAWGRKAASRKRRSCWRSSSVKKKKPSPCWNANSSIDSRLSSPTLPT